MEDTGLKRRLGLFSAMTMLVGSVVGASIWIVPGVLASTIGPSAWLSYAIGGALILFVCIIFAQIGSVIPLSGANYVLCSKTISTFWGFLYMWFYVILNIILFPIMAFGIVKYLGVFFPLLNNVYVAILILVLTGAINLVGFGLSSSLQNVLVMAEVSVIFVFIAIGAFFIHPSNFVPMFPKGVEPVIAGSISTYFAFAGFNGIIELSGEIKDPRKNLPKTIFFSLTLIGIMYIGMCLVLTGLVPWTQLGVDAPAVLAAKMILPNWFGYIIAFAMLASGWTVINAAIAAVSRDVYALASSRIFPQFMGKLNKYGTPYVAVIMITILAVIATSLSANMLKYINICSVYLLMSAIVIAVASLRIREKLPQQYNNASFKLKGFWYYFWPIGTIVTSLAFLGLAFKDDVKVSILAIIMIAVAAGIFFTRKKHLESQGIFINELIQTRIEEETRGIDLPD